jgi:hypothetical protein
MKCPNIEHNLSWQANGAISPCNNLVDFPLIYSVTQLHDSDAYQQLAQDFKSPHCQRCWDKEALGIDSKRITDIKLHAIYNQIDSNYIKIDAAIGDVCNAACRICGSHSSTLWQSIIPIENTRTADKTLWATCQHNIDHIVQLDFGGGEPWVNDVEQQVELFDQLIAKGRHHLIKLRYNTNGSIWPRHLLDKIVLFREVEITLSLDDIESRFEYNRWPLSWNTVNSNLAKFLQLADQHKNIKLTVNFTVSVFTWLRAAQFTEWANNHGLTKINFNILANPAVYSIKSLPEPFKTLLPSTKFDKLVCADPILDWQEQFKKITANLDQQRGQRLVDTFPELSIIL